MSIQKKLDQLIAANVWVPICHGAKSTGDGWEISVIRSSNTHCYTSYGWDGEDKIVISERDDSEFIPKDIYVEMLKRTMALATDVAAMMNAADKAGLLPASEESEDEDSDEIHAGEWKFVPIQPAFLFRFHRGTFEESMKTVVSFSDIGELQKLLWEVYGMGEIGFNGPPVFDERCGWHTWTVTLNGNAVGQANGNPAALVQQ